MGTNTLGLRSKQQELPVAHAAIEAPPADTPNPSPHEGTPELNPRARVMAELAERSNLRADAEAQEPMPPSDDEPVPSTDEPVEGDTPAETPDETPSETPAEAATEAATAPEFNPDQEYDLIVDGKPIKVKGSQILERGRAAIQKEAAADYKLEMATKLLEEARSLAKPAQPAKEEPVKLTAEQLAEIIQFGTKEQAAAAISEIMQGQQQGKEIEKMASALPAVVSDQIAFHDATLFVQSEYKDLMSDPDLRSLFFMKENGMRQAGDNRAYKELYKVIGDELRVKFNRPAPATNKTIEQKKEAKAAAPSVPRLASARLEASPEKKAPTTQEVIDKMRAARGQRPHATIN